MRFVCRTSIAFLVVAIMGCNNSPSIPVTAESTDLEAADVVESPVVDVDVKSWEQIQQWVASQQGKVVVVDVWSSSCLPCVKEFPNFVALHEQFAGEVACASINIDYYGSEDDKPDDLKPSVLKFLASKQATMQNFISSDPDEDVLKQIDTAAPPASLVYGRDGKLHTIFHNDESAYGPEGFNYEKDIVPLVQQLLKPDGT